jgi:uncharacterized protein YbjT (DUF2867 family)
MVLVVGATGLVGSEVCQKLAKGGEKVRALVRTTSSKEKVEALRACDAEICVGDLKEPSSISAACQGVDAVISTASSTLSRQAGDSIESVDAAGQMNLVNAAKTVGVDRFVFVSFRQLSGISSPLGDAKRVVEQAITSMQFSIIQASWFMEVWLSPALGFDFVNAAARIYGPGTSPVSWVSYRDVAEMCSVALRHPAAARQTIAFGGPEALSPLEAVARFEEISGKRFKIEHIPERTLRRQFDESVDSMQKSFAALMLGYLNGDAVNMTPIVKRFGIQLTSVREYARSVLGIAAEA